MARATNSKASMARTLAYKAGPAGQPLSGPSTNDGPAGQTPLLRPLTVRSPDYHSLPQNEASAEQQGCGEEIRFGHFCAVPAARCLYANDRPVEIGSRAFDLLILLLRRRGTVVSKTEIMSEVWPSITVDESNLRFQMAAVRKVLGADRELIKTIPGRGYLLAGPPGRSSSSAPSQTIEKESAYLSGRGVDLVPTSRQADGQTLKSLFKLVGLEIDTLPSVRDALMKLACDSPIGIVLDLRLLDQACMDMLVQLARCDKRLSIILISDDAQAPISLKTVAREPLGSARIKSGSLEAIASGDRDASLVGEAA